MWFFPFVFRDKKGENGLRGSGTPPIVVETLLHYISLSTIMFGYCVSCFQVQVSMVAQQHFVAFFEIFIELWEI